MPEHFYRCELAISNQHAQVGARRGAGVRHPVRSLLRLAKIPLPGQPVGAPHRPVFPGSMEAQALALMRRKMRAAQTLYGDEVGGTIVPVGKGDFVTELAREVLRGVELGDLQSLFADEMRVSNSPMGSPSEVNPVLIPVNPKTRLEWALEHQAAKATARRRSTSKRSNVVQPGQLSIWSNLKEE